jgi:tRNA1(Val) A37 N6-methylase TrmN6
MIKKEVARKKIKELVERFEQHKRSYLLPSYNEKQVCSDFIEKFFAALEWDVNNDKGNSEMYREVLHAERQVVNGRAEIPDFSFRLEGGKRLFFVEAKRPGIDIRKDAASAYQLRRYGWNAGMPLSIITSFEKFIIYDCTQKPKPGDKPGVARIRVFTYRDYIDEFDFFWNTFGRNQVTKGHLDAFITDKDRKGSSTVDTHFLQTLNHWRKLLANSIARNNTKLRAEDVGLAVQRIINRIIFLRIAEDRGAEHYGKLKECIGSSDPYQALRRRFRQADERYHSGIFDLSRDLVTANVIVDDKPIVSIISSLYYPETDYEFSIMPVEILGTAYEQYLGKQVILLPGHRARIEDKPEVRKAGGVYYTPEYIVDHIIESTVKKLVEGKSPDEIAKIKILDPACGSGSFLIAAYQYLLDYHKKYYNRIRKSLSKDAIDPEKSISKRTAAVNKRGKLPLTPDGELTLKKKKEILVNNIFGTDLDLNAAEVARLSLSLKCMEGETHSSIQSLDLNERALPPLDDNIKWGNSLVSDKVPDEDEDHFKAFDWKEEFPKVFANGGFDAVIGNPPYVMLQKLETRSMFDYARNNYECAKYKIDTYQLFIEASVKILREKGLLGFIIPNTFLKNVHSEPLRRFILAKTSLSEIMVFDYSVFKAASVDTCILITQRGKASARSSLTVKRVSTKFTPEVIAMVNQSSFLKNKRADFNVSITERDENVIERMRVHTAPLGNYCNAYFGIQTHDREKHVSRTKLNQHYKPVIDGTNIDPFGMKAPKEYVEFIPKAIKSGGKEFVYQQQRICIRQIGEIPIATIVEPGIYTLNTVYNIYMTSEEIDLHFVLGVINSLPAKYYWRKVNSDEKRTFPKIKKDALLSIPMPIVRSSHERRLHNEMVHLVKELLELYAEQYAERLGSHKIMIEADIEKNEQRVNEIVCELYGLKSRDISVIEKAMEKKSVPADETMAGLESIIITIMYSCAELE